MHFDFPLPLRTLRLSILALLSLLLVSQPAVAQTPPKGSGSKGPEPTTPCAMSFSDVTPSNYFYEGVQYLFCAGAISGYPDGTFRPNNPASRGQLTKIISIAKGWPLVNPPSPSFSDVPVGSPFYVYVETARAHGVIGGFPDGTFRPGDNISRGQLAKVVALAQAWQLLNPGTPTFSDVSPGTTFYQYVETAAARAVISGYSDGTFRPNNLATRGQISKIIYVAVGFHLTAEEQQTVDLINSRRAALGLSTLRVNVALTFAARRHSNNIGPLGLCQHDGTDGSSPWDRIAQAGYGGYGLGEVVGCNYSTPLGVVDGWWGSPAHYAILTATDINDIGCGWWINPTTGGGWQTCDTGSSN